MDTYYVKFYAVIVCRVYKGSVRFNTIATAFKKITRKYYPFKQSWRWLIKLKLNYIILTEIQSVQL